MTFQIPVQDQRYADSGRRDVIIAGRTVGASLKKLRPSEAVHFNATHEMFIAKISGVAPGVIIDFDGVKYQVTRVLDPKANDPIMRNRYLKMICVIA